MDKCGPLARGISKILRDDGSKKFKKLCRCRISTWNMKTRKRKRRWTLKYSSESSQPVALLPWLQPVRRSMKCMSRVTTRSLYVDMRTPTLTLFPDDGCNANSAVRFLRAGLQTYNQKHIRQTWGKWEEPTWRYVPSLSAYVSQPHRDMQEQRKAALRKVELELDEADDIVRSPSVNAHNISTSLFSF